MEKDLYPINDTLEVSDAKPFSSAGTSSDIEVEGSAYDLLTSPLVVLPIIIISFIIVIFTFIKFFKRKIKIRNNKPLSIFVSYRRQDSADVSGRIYDRLVNKYGKKNIFKDVYSIPLGIDFRTYIDGMVSKVDIFIVVIGPEWVGNKVGGRRIDDPLDLVRLEVKSALDRKIPVIPLLVRNTDMVNEKDLPYDIQGLAFRNGIPIRSDPDFDSDITKLLSGLSSQEESLS